MRKYLVIIFLFTSTSLLKAQPAIPDSTRYALQNSHIDSHYVKRLIVAISYLPYSHPDSAYYYADSTLRLSQRLKYNDGISFSYSLIAEYYIYRGDYSKAIFYIYQCLNLSNSLKDIGGVIRSFGQLSEIYSELGGFRKALDFQLQIMERVTPLGYRTTDDWYNPNNMPQEYFYNYNLGKAYLNMKMVDSAMYYGEKAFRAHSQWSIIPILMGDICFLNKDYTNALKYYNTHTTENYTVDTVKNYIGKANVFRMIQRYDSCRYFALQAFDIARRMKFAKGVMQASELLSFYYEQNDLNESLKYLKISNQIRDSLFNAGRVSQVNGIAFNDELRRLDVIAAEKAAMNKYKIWSLFGVLTTLLITGALLWRNSHQRKKANILLQQQKEKVESTLSELKQTQAQLIHSEKMASLGELAAGIAHEIQNPLNFVNNFSHVNNELIAELKEEAEKGNLEEVKFIADDIAANEQKINHHGQRADAIVKGMLQHSRSGSGQKEATDINALADEYLRLAYHGVRAKDKDFNATLHTDFDTNVDKLNVIPQDIGRVLLNLYNNAFYAVSAEAMVKSNDHYEPSVSVNTKKVGDKIEIRVKDNGSGISEKIRSKIFQPFFTTKPTGQGTGLGLSLSYDIVKAHGGEINVRSNEDKGSEFIVSLPYLT